MDCLYSLSGPSLSILPGLARLPRLPLFLAAEWTAHRIHFYFLSMIMKSNLQCLKKKIELLSKSIQFPSVNDNKTKSSSTRKAGDRKIQRILTQLTAI